MGKFKIGDKCRIVVDWATKKKVMNATAKVVGVQKNGNQTFIRIRWLGIDSQVLEEQYGSLFHPDELKAA